MMVGRFDEAISEMLRARELDPLSPSIMQGLALVLITRRVVLTKSITTSQNMLEAVPDFAYGLATYSWALRHVGRTRGSRRSGREGVVDCRAVDSFLLPALGAAYAAAGRTRTMRARRSNDSARCQRSCYVSPYHRALIHLHLGEHEQALALLREAYAINDGWLVWLGVEPQLDPLRADPAFAELLTQNEKSGGTVAGVRRMRSAAAQR